MPASSFKKQRKREVGKLALTWRAVPCFSAPTYEWQKYDSFSTLQRLLEGAFSPINVDRFNICFFNIEMLQQRSYRCGPDDINGSL